MLVEEIWLTAVLSWLATALLLPPYIPSPQATTESSALSAAKLVSKGERQVLQMAWLDDP